MSSIQLEKIYKAILKIGRFPKQKRYNIRNNPDVAPRGAVFGLIKLRQVNASVKDIDVYPSKLSFYPKYTELYRLLEELMWDYNLHLNSHLYKLMIISYVLSIKTLIM